MNVAAERPFSRSRAWLGLGCLLLIFIAWRVLTLGVAEFLARVEPDAALRWSSGNAEAQFQREERNSRLPLRARGAEARIRRAIRSAPLDGRGYRLLAVEAEKEGKLASASSFYALAAIRGPRDLPAAAWLARNALARGDSATALRHIDQMLRVQPELDRKLYLVLMAMAADSTTQPSLARFLLGKPPWRERFLLFLFQHSPSSSTIFRMVEQLRRTKGALSDTELSAWVDRLVKDHQWGSAYLIWAQSLPGSVGRHIGNVFDGSFETEPTEGGFGWRFKPIAGAQITRTQVTGAKDEVALRVAFEDRRVPFQNVRQLLALAPGHYQLAGRVRLDDLRAERGLVWTITCAEDDRQLAETEPMSGSTAWRSFTLDLDVPTEACGGQWLTLRIPARIAAEQLIGGVAWFDDLSIQSSQLKFTD